MERCARCNNTKELCICREGWHRPIPVVKEFVPIKHEVEIITEIDTLTGLVIKTKKMETTINSNGAVNIIDAFKLFIISMRKNHSSAFTSVKKTQLNDVLIESNIPFGYRAPLISFFKEEKLLIEQGATVSLRYRWNENDLITDLDFLARMAESTIKTYLASKKQKKEHIPKVKLNKEQIPFSPAVKVEKKDFHLGDTVYVMEENKIRKCTIIGISAIHELNENNETWDNVGVTIYSLLFDDKKDKIQRHSVYSSIDSLVLKLTKDFQNKK